MSSVYVPFEPEIPTAPTGTPALYSGMPPGSGDRPSGARCVPGFVPLPVKRVLMSEQGRLEICTPNNGPAGAVASPMSKCSCATWPAVREENALLSGDVLFQGSVGRVDLPGGDWPTLLASIDSLMAEFSEETAVYPGHMGITSLGRERATNPFLRELAER